MPKPPTLARAHPHDTEVLSLDNHLCYALYVASRRTIRAYSGALAELGITHPQYLVLLVLWEWDRTRMRTPNYLELGRRIDLDSGTLTPLLNRLEARGLIVREAPKHDRRERYVTLTKEGRALKRRALRVPRALVARAPLSSAEIGRLRDALHRLSYGLARSESAEHTDSRADSRTRRARKTSRLAS